MSKVELLDLDRLRARLALLLDANDLDGSLFLQAIGALFLACNPASAAELGIWESLFFMQADEESVEADRLLDLLCMLDQVQS